MANFPNNPTRHTPKYCPSHRTALQQQIPNLLSLPLINPPTLSQCINLYIQYQRPISHLYLNYFARMSLANAIFQAALSTCPVCGRLNPHQNHIGYSKCRQWANYLRGVAGLSANLANAKNFEDIIHLIQVAYAKWPLAQLNGKNQLLVYDTALHVSVQLRRLPHALVYLHASAIVPSVPGRYRGKHFGTLPFSTFLPLFKRNHMTAFEIENFLCNFNDVLKKYQIPVIR